MNNAPITNAKAADGLTSVRLTLVGADEDKAHARTVSIVRVQLKIPFH